MCRPVPRVQSLSSTNAVVSEARSSQVSSKVKPGIWRRSHYLDRMTLKDLWVAYFQYPAIIGYLALNNRIGILPVYLWGTYEAFPKGMTIPKADSIGAKIGAKVGRFIEYDELEQMTTGISRNEAYRLIAARVQHEVENLRDNTHESFDADELRKKWRAERRKARKAATTSVD